MSGYPDGAFWDIAAIPYTTPTENCGLALAGGCPNCLASVLSYDPKADEFVPDPISPGFAAEIDLLTAGGGMISALSSWSIARRAFVSATVMSVTTNRTTGWDWDSAITSAMQTANAVAIFEVKISNGSLALLRFGSSNTMQSLSGALLGPTIGNAGRASHLTVGACSVSMLVVPSDGSTDTFKVLPEE